MPGRSPETAGDRRMNSKSRILYMFLQQKMLGPHSGAIFFFLIVFWEDGLPEMLSKLSVLAERDIKK